MSDAKKAVTKKTDDAKKDPPKGDSEPKEKKAGPNPKADDPKKDISKTDDKPKDAAPKKDDSKKDLDSKPKQIDSSPKEGSVGAGDPRGKTPDTKQKDLKTAEIQALAKSITDEFNQISALFSKNLEKTLKAVSESPEAVEKLQKNHTYFRTMEGVCKSAQACAKETFAKVVSTFDQMNSQLVKTSGVKESASTGSQQTEELVSLIAKVDREFKTVFEEKCKEELEQSKKGFETVTMKGLESQSEQRLMSANLAIKNQDKNKSGHKGAVEESKVKRTVLSGLFDKDFVGYKNLAVSMEIRRDLNSEKTENFRHYKKYFVLKATPDTVLKGMGRLR